MKQRTIFDPNDFIVNGDITEIVLRNNKGIEVSRAIIDTVCYEVVKDYKWYFDKRGYVKSANSGKTIRLHRLVTNAPQGMVVDHINGNTLNNRYSNLRVCTQQENSRNRTKNKSSTSGCVGVSWHKNKKLWQAHIGYNRETIYLGSFHNINDAIAARKVAEEKYFGEFAYNPEAHYGT